MLAPILYSAVSGVLGTGLGGIIGILFIRKYHDALGILLSFAAGIMIGVSCFDLIPEALLLCGIWKTTLGIIVGGLLVALLNVTLSMATSAHKKTKRSNNLYTRSGILMLTAIALHNLPEGLAIGASGGHDPSMGLTVAVLIAIHDIPEGMSVALPLWEGGISKGKAILIAACSGIPTFFGGILGVLLSVSDALVGVSLAIAGGAMLYVTFCEMIPKTLTLKKVRGSLIILLTGIICGLMAAKLLSH